MSTIQNVSRACVGFCLAVAIPMAGLGQERLPAMGVGGPLTGTPVLDAPFTADAITTVRLAFRDGTRLDQTTTAHYYRDCAGRNRVELMMDGLDAPKTLAERHIRTIVDPAPRGTIFTLDPVTRMAHYLPRSLVAFAAGGGREFAVPIGGVRFLTFHRALDLLASNAATPGSLGEDVRDESLGNRQIAGVETTGRRITMTIPIGHLSNDRPIQMVDERWESTELKVLVSAHSSDSRTGDVEYRLTNIRRVEPPAELFVVPPDYTIDNNPVPELHDPWITLIPAERYPASLGRGGRERE